MLCLNRSPKEHWSTGKCTKQCHPKSRGTLLSVWRKSRDGETTNRWRWCTASSLRTIAKITMQIWQVRALKEESKSKTAIKIVPKTLRKPTVRLEASPGNCLDRNKINLLQTDKNKCLMIVATNRTLSWRNRENRQKNQKLSLFGVLWSLKYGSFNGTKRRQSRTDVMCLIRIISLSAQ